jgi:hypothetical protein
MWFWDFCSELYERTAGSSAPIYVVTDYGDAGEHPGLVPTQRNAVVGLVTACEPDAKQKRYG